MSSLVDAQGRFLSGSTMGHVVRMTATGAFGITFVFLVDLMNLFWVSQLGQPKLVAAIGFAYGIQFFSVSSAIGLMIAATAVISRAIGRGDRDYARNLAGAALVMGVIFQFCLALCVFLFRHELIALLGATGETAELAARYLGMTIFSLVPMAVGMMCSGSLRADGFGAKAMYVTLLSGAILAVIDPILIVGMGLGLDGAALGLVIFRFAMMGFALFFAVHQERLVSRPTVVSVRAGFAVYVAVAIPTIATQMATPTGNVLLTAVMAQFGDEAMAAWAVVGRLTVVVFGGIFALSGAIGGIFGQNYGAGQMDRVRATYRDALMFCAIYTLVAWALMVGSSAWLADVFELDANSTDVLSAFTLIGVGGFVFVGALFVSNAAFNNLGKPGRSTLVNWLNHGVLSWPFAVLLAGAAGAPGVIYGQTAAGVIAGALAAIWGWVYVRDLQPDAGVDLAPPRPYPNPDRYRNR